MDKQREEFEKWAAFNGMGLYIYTNLSKYADSDTEAAWQAWQAAKAQADQKIKLLLCDEHLKKCESPAGVFNSQYPDEEPCLICLAKEAKAQAVPEGFVLVPKEPTKEMLIAADNCEIDGKVTAHNIYKAMLEPQEPTND